MKSCGFYTNGRIDESDYKVDTVPLIVNCTGLEYSDEPFTQHKIRKDYQLIYVTHNYLPVMVNNTKQLLTAGSFIVLEPDIFYGYTSEAAPTYYWLHFSGYDSEKVLRRLNIPTNKAVKIGIEEEITSCFTRIFTEFMISDRYFQITTSSLLSEILAYISRKSNTDTKFPLASINYIHNHYDKNITLEELAAIENISVSHFRKIFKKNVDMSPQEYIIQQRINVACKYLAQSAMSNEEISSMVGYNDPFYFSRIFKKKIGMSPKQYHKLHNKKNQITLYEKK